MKNSRTFTVAGMPLIKFQNQDRIDSLRSGIIYAKTLKYYRDKEQETGDADIGDEFEAMIHINSGFMYIPDNNQVFNLDDALIQTIHSDDYVFCMFGISIDHERFEFSNEQKEKMLSFGDHALMKQSKSPSGAGETNGRLWRCAE